MWDWTGLEEYEGTPLCSACAPTKFNDGTPSKYGKWHDKWDQIFLPLGEFETNDEGNLRHKKTNLSVTEWKEKHAISRTV